MEHPCVDCGTVQDRWRCHDCLVVWLRDMHRPADENRLRAHNYKLREYYATCPEHGLVLHRGDNDVCLTCTPRRPDSARAIARRAGERTYAGNCPTHGVVGHDVNSGKCRVCVPLATKERGPQNPDRIAARDAGARTFRAYCPVHVEADHYVTTGKCCECFTSVGALRDASGRSGPSPRAAARRAGDVTYADACEIHGPAALHHVNTGKCLTCFTATGARRVR